MMKTKEDQLREEIRQEAMNVNDQLYINLLKFLGAIIVLVGVAVLIDRGLRFDLTSIVLFVMGLAIIAGAAIWSADDEHTMKKVYEIKEDITDEESGAERTDNYSQNN